MDSDSLLAYRPLGNLGNCLSHTQALEGRQLFPPWLIALLMNTCHTQDGDEDDSGAAWLNDNIDELRPIKRLRHENIFSGEFVTRLELPAQMKVEKVEDPAEMEAALDARMKAWSCPPMPQQRQPPTKKDIAAIIAAASAAEAARAAEATAAAAAASQPPAEAAPKKKSKPPRKTQTHEEKEANKEKRLMKLVGTVVVKCMSKHSKQMDTTQFKKHAKEVRMQCRSYSPELTRAVAVDENHSR